MSMVSRINTSTYKQIYVNINRDYDFKNFKPGSQFRRIKYNIPHTVKIKMIPLK